MLSEKNAQVSLFIIISILIAGLVIAFVLYNNQSVIKENINPEIQPIHNYVKSCIKNAGRESIYSLSLQGGYSFDISDIEYSDKSLSCISEWSIQYDLYFSMEDYEEDIVIFSITDKNSNINGEELEFKFANRY